VSTVFDEAAVAPAEERFAGIWTRAYALRHCEGYIVDGPRGHVGFVSDVVETDDSLELLVDGEAGELRVPVEAIECFEPHAERIVVTRASR
jgi:hypothetical protein